MDTSDQNIAQTTQAVQKMRLYISLIVIGIVVLIVAPLIYTGIIIYGGFGQNNLTKTVVRYLPYPAIIVNNDWISYNDYQTDVNQLEHVTEQFATDPVLSAQAGTLPTRSELAQQEMDRQIDSAMVQQVAAAVGVSVTITEVDQAFDQQVLTQAQGDEAAVAETLQQLYGWTIADFKTEVVTELVLRQKLLDYLLEHDKDTVSKGQREQLEQLQAQLAQKPDDFSSLAEQYSEDGSAPLGGDLGWIKPGETVEPFEQASFPLTEPNQISDIVETQFGYHLIQLVERKAAEGEEPAQVHVRHILLKYSLDSYLQQQEDNAKVYRLVDPTTI